MVNYICDQISFITSKCETQSGKKMKSVEYSTQYIIYAKREQKKPLLLKLTTLRSCFTLPCEQRPFDLPR